MQSDQSFRNRESSESRRPAELEFILDLSAVCLDRPAAQSESRGDVGDAQSFCNRNEDLALAESQGLVTSMIHQMPRERHPI
jgi:hypothetical protein